MEKCPSFPRFSLCTEPLPFLITAPYSACILYKTFPSQHCLVDTLWPQPAAIQTPMGTRKTTSAHFMVLGTCIYQYAASSSGTNASVVVWIRSASIGSYIWILSHQGVELFNGIRQFRRCVLVGGSVPLNFKVPETQARSSLFLYLWIRI